MALLASGVCPTFCSESVLMVGEIVARDHGYRILLENKIFVLLLHRLLTVDRAREVSRAKNYARRDGEETVA